jgi:hypothetical protein
MKLLIVLFLFVAGCADIRGGQTRHDTGTLSISYDGVTITDTRETIATTQPSARGIGDGSKFQIQSQKEEGLLGGVSFTQAKSNALNNWLVALILIGVGVLLWLVFAQRLAAVGCWAMAVLVLIYPPAAIAACILALVYFGYNAWRLSQAHGVQTVAFKQVVKGVETAMEEVPPAVVPTIKTAMATVQDESTKAAVAEAKVPETT